MNEMQTTNFNAPATAAPQGVMTATANARETAEIQSMMVIAKNFPRDERRVLDLILNDCQRPSLAQKALYQYSRGGSDISGPSIHLAKAIAKRWGNMKSGIVELEQKNGESICEAYALDLESNYKESKIFSVPHIRSTKRGTYRLEDPRDIYELVANNGSRRERACILSVIPGDIVDEAVEQCTRTLMANADVSPENIKKMCEMFFGEFGVTREQIEKRIQRRIDSITPAQMVNLRSIYNSLKDGMSNPGDWFETTEENKAESSAGKSGKDAVADALGVGGKDKTAAKKKADMVFDEFTPLIVAEIKKSGAPVSVEEVLKYAAGNGIELKLDTDFADLVDKAANNSLL